MHMADALISTQVGATMWAVSGSAILYSSHKIKKEKKNIQIPLMGVLGAFIFAAQMINFSIPGTGSSGHICGSILLSVILGPYAAILVITSILIVQSLMFADGGLLALGCNIFNMGVAPCFLGYLLVYKPIIGESTNRKRIFIAIIAATLIGMESGALSVVFETTLSGISALPFKQFTLLMLPIHSAIAIVEGVITASILNLILNTKPNFIMEQLSKNKQPKKNRQLIRVFFVSSLLIAGIISWFASSRPDGLEWAIAKVANNREIHQKDTSLKNKINIIQTKTAILPDYSFNSKSNHKLKLLGTSTAGIIGTITTLLLAIFAGFILKIKKDKNFIPVNNEYTT